MTDAWRAVIEVDPRPYGSQTVVVIHPAIWWQIKPLMDQHVYYIGDRLSGMRVYQYSVMYSDTGEIVPVPQDQVFMVHEDALCLFMLAESAYMADLAKKYPIRRRDRFMRWLRKVARRGV